MTAPLALALSFSPPSVSLPPSVVPWLFSLLFPFCLLSCVWMEKLGSLEPADPLPGARPVAGVSAEGDEEAAAVSSKLFRCAFVRRWLPLAYREELYQVLHLTGPLVSRGKLKCWWGGLVCCIHKVLPFLEHSVTVLLCYRATVECTLIRIKSNNANSFYSEIMCRHFMHKVK